MVNKENLIYKYLIPVYRDIPQEEQDKIRPLAIKAINYYITDTQGEKYKILIEVKDYDNAVELAKQSKYFDKIIVKGHALKPSSYIVYLNISEKYHNAYDMFSMGKYSKMYTEEQLKALFNYDDEEDKGRLDVLRKTNNGLKRYKEMVYKEFGIILNNNEAPDDYDRKPDTREIVKV